MRLRTLVADDSALFRRVLSDTLGGMPDIEVIGTAFNGRQAVQRVQELQPDLLTLDMEMPELDGLGVLDALRQAGSRTSVIVLSALTRKGGQLTMRALEKGAFDFITKPDTTNADQSRAAILAELAPRVRALGHRLEVRNLLRPANGGPPARGSGTPATSPARGTPSTSPGASSSAAAGSLQGIADRMHRVAHALKPEVVVIGVSTGGPNALARLLPALPASLGVPVLIVQHMPPVFTQSLAESLSSKCVLRVKEACHGEVAEANTVYIAPGGHHMRLVPAGDRARSLQITDDPPENNCRPAVDYLFRSAAQHYPGRALAVILTGMGNDGTLGVRLMKRSGCLCIAQDEASCVVYGMPKSVVEAGVADAVLPLDQIAARIVSTVRGGGG